MFYSGPVTWSDAAQYCLDYTDGNLASAKTAEQQEFLLNISSIYAGRCYYAFLSI